MLAALLSAACADEPSWAERDDSECRDVIDAADLCAAQVKAAEDEGLSFQVCLGCVVPGIPGSPGLGGLDCGDDARAGEVGDAFLKSVPIACEDYIATLDQPTEEEASAARQFCEGCLLNTDPSSECGIWRVTQPSAILCDDLRIHCTKD